MTDRHALEAKYACAEHGVTACNVCSTVTVSSGNVFEDLGLPDSDELLALAKTFARAMKDQGSIFKDNQIPQDIQTRVDQIKEWTMVNSQPIHGYLDKIIDHITAQAEEIGRLREGAVLVHDVRMKERGRYKALAEAYEAEHEAVAAVIPHGVSDGYRGLTYQDDDIDALRAAHDHAESVRQE